MYITDARLSTGAGGGEVCAQITSNGQLKEGEGWCFIRDVLRNDRMFLKKMHIKFISSWLSKCNREDRHHSKKKSSRDTPVRTCDSADRSCYNVGLPPFTAKLFSSNAHPLYVVFRTATHNFKRLKISHMCLI